MTKLITKLTHLLLISVLLIQNIIYPWISILPAPPPVYAQESPPIPATNSAQTPAPSPLDPLLSLEEIFPSTQSAETIPPEVIPEATPSATPVAIPEATASATPTSSITPSIINPPTLSSPSPTPIASPTPDSETETTSTVLLDPFFISLSYPFTGSYPITYAFGQDSPNDYISSMQSLFGVTSHDGVDYAMDEGTPIMATSDGTIISAGPGLYGTTIQIKHTWGTSYYGHLSQLMVNDGEIVKGGQIIGYSGNTGVSTGPHLHFAIRPTQHDLQNGYHGLIDPLPYLTGHPPTGKVLGVANTSKRHKTHHFNLVSKTVKGDLPQISVPFAADPSALTLTLKDPHNTIIPLDPPVNDFGTGPTIVLEKPDPFYPGEYVLSATDSLGNYDEQNFSWGVLAINPNKSIYHPGETAELAFAVLDNRGEMVCDADLSLVITGPFGVRTTLSTGNGSITVNQGVCQSKELTITPDYQSSYKVNGSGIYHLELTANTSSGSYTISDEFSVASDAPFYIERSSATRIYPVNTYPVKIMVTPSSNYQGLVSEPIPDGFSLSDISPGDGQIIQNKIVWQVDWTAGVTYELSYAFDAPDVSPAFYLLGPLTLSTWQEPRAWQIAGDAVTDYSFQRKTWHDGTRYWQSYLDTTNSRIRFDYSSDGTSWTENTSARIAVNTADFSIEADSTNLLVVYTSSNDIRGLKATSYPGTSFAWGAEGTIFNGSGATDDYSYPVITRDSSSYVWVGARFTGSSVYYIKTIKEAGGTNDLPEDSADTVYSLADTTSSNANVYANLVSLGSQNVYATFTVNASIKGCKWVNTSTAWQDSSGNPCTTPSSWYSPSWPYRLKLTIDHTKVGADQTDFPVYVNLADLPAAFHSHVNQTDARDIRVTTSNGTTELPREVVFYTAASDTGELYFKYTGTLSSTVDTDVYIYYGNASASDYAVTDTYGTQNVWDTNYKGVWHFTEASGTHYDSTSNNNDSTAVAVTTQGTANAKFGGADDFDATDDVITLGTDTSLDLNVNGTIESWIYPNGWGESGYGMLVTRGPGSNVGYQLYTRQASTNLAIWDGVSVQSPTISLNAWTHAVAVMAGSTMTFYTNGSADAGHSWTVASTGVDTAYIGSNNGANTFDGQIDEMRISSTARSSTWLSTQYNNQNSSSTFYAEGAETNINYQDTIATGLSGLTTTLSSVSDASGNVHLIYINPSGNTVYQERTTSWQTAVTLDSNAGNAYPTISYNSTTTDVYAFWVRSADIFYKKGVSTYASGNWDASATSWQTSGTNTYVSSNYSGANYIFAEWYDGTSVAWAKILPSNVAPSTPTTLAQTTTADVTISTGGWVSATSTKFSATAADTDNPDTLYLCVEKDLLGTSFSNTEDSCGTGVSYSGTGVTVTHTISSQTDASQYHWQVRIKDAAGAYSAWVSYGGNAESAADYGLDTTAPTGGTVYDGTGVGVDAIYSTASLSTLSANWASINTDVSGLNKYEYSVGTTTGGTDIKTWTDNSTTTSVTATGLTLASSTPYYFNLRTTDGAGNVSTPISSNGQLVSPSISFTISPTTLTFNNLTPLNSYTDDTKTTTLTTSTNAYNGYIIRSYVADYLRSTDDNSTIPDFTGGTYDTPATWVGSETGFGYTSSDTTIGGLNKFGTGTLYAPFSHVGPGDIVADHTSTVSGTAIADEVFTLSYKVKAPANQAAKNYRTNIIYTATAQY